MVDLRSLGGLIQFREPPSQFLACRRFCTRTMADIFGAFCSNSSIVPDDRGLRRLTRDVDAMEPRARSAVHLLFAHDVDSVPGIVTPERSKRGYWIAPVADLVRMKLPPEALVARLGEVRAAR